MNLRPALPFAKLAGAALLAFLVPAAQAGYVYELSSKGGSGQEAESSKVMIEGSNLKIVQPGSKDEVIFRGKDATMLAVNHQNKSYTEIDKKTLESMMAKIQEAMAQYEQMLANVPPAQREMVERMMGDRMPKVNTEASKITVELEEQGKGGEVNGFDTTHYALLHDGKKTSEFWVADWSEVKGGQAVTDAFVTMSSFFQDLMDTLAKSPMGGMMTEAFKTDAWVSQLASLEGFPVRTQTYDAAGNLVSESNLLGVQEEEFEKGTFQAPRGYKRQKLAP